MSEELQQELLQQYVDNRAFIHNIQNELSMDLPHYTNLEWRLDVKVTSKHAEQDGTVVSLAGADISHMLASTVYHHSGQRL